MGTPMEEIVGHIVERVSRRARAPETG